MASPTSREIPRPASASGGSPFGGRRRLTPPGPGGERSIRCVGGRRLAGHAAPGNPAPDVDLVKILPPVLVGHSPPGGHPGIEDRVAPVTEGVGKAGLVAHAFRGGDEAPHRAVRRRVPHFAQRGRQDVPQGTRLCRVVVLCGEPRGAAGNDVAVVLAWPSQPPFHGSLAAEELPRGRQASGRTRTALSRSDGKRCNAWARGERNAPMPNTPPGTLALNSKLCRGGVPSPLEGPASRVSMGIAC
jgi:hypothetical protein